MFGFRPAVPGVHAQTRRICLWSRTIHDLFAPYLVNAHGRPDARSLFERNTAQMNISWLALKNRRNAVLGPTAARIIAVPSL